jgi:hypothetical protein
MSCTLGKQGVVLMYEFITVLLTSLVLLHITFKRKNVDYKIGNVGTRKVFENGLLDDSGAILIKYGYGKQK